MHIKQLYLTITFLLTVCYILTFSEHISPNFGAMDV